MIRSLVPKLETNVTGLSNFFSIFGSAFTMFMVLVLVAEVTLRLFDRGVWGAYEMVEFAMVPLIFLSMAQVQARKKNINMDLLYNLLPKQLHPIIDLLNDFISLIIFCIMTYAAILQTVYLYRINDASAILNIPKFYFMGIEVLGLTILCLVLLVDALASLGKIGTRKN